MYQLLLFYGFVVTSFANGIVLMYLYVNDTTRFGKLNYRFISKHILGSLFLMIGIRQFAYLAEYSIIENLSEHGINAVVSSTSAYAMTNMFDWIFFASLLGFHISLIISLTVMLRKKIAFINLFVVFAGSIILLGVLCYKFETLLDVRDSVGHLFHGSLLAFKYIIPSILFISLALIMYFTGNDPMKKSTGTGGDTASA